ncbi:hypothetical protein FNV43_RR02277 [Rhamnella rubrinervis]|uniref:Uncharacterized protein n=1 Tax=Rhamnella rubrinervis TaxID=2594499 RepID=A0A8K0HTJ0_9ROSA|nr:hypothetical protein FNV43_RR02277 [Rhamnella rubrinervis]
MRCFKPCKPSTKTNIFWKISGNEIISSHRVLVTSVTRPSLQVSVSHIGMEPVRLLCGASNHVSLPPRQIFSGRFPEMKSFPVRVLVTSVTRPSLQSKKDKEVTETCEKTKEAAEAVEQGAKEVRETCKFMRDTVETTAER